MLLSTFLNCLINVAVQLIVLIPLFWLAKKTYSSKDRKLLWIMGLLFLMDALLVTYFANVRFFPGQRWNWAGKCATIAWTTLFIYVNTIISRKETGWTIRMQPGTRGFFLAILVLLAVIKMALFLPVNKQPVDLRPETILFQATLPGIAEEILFRGILLSMLNKVLPPKWNLFDIKLGWGAIISSVLFGLTHGFYMDSAWSLHFITLNIIRTAIDGFFLALVKEKTKSLLPPIIIHNVLDLIVVLW